MQPWIYNGNPLTEADIDDNIGFIYLITNLKTGRKYIGKKQFYASRVKITTLKLKNGTKKKKRSKIKVYNDWMEYWGSNKELLTDIESLGIENFKREVLHLCKSKGSLSYMEAKEQFKVDAILSPDYYNDWMTIKVSAKHLIGLEYNG